MSVYLDGGRLGEHGSAPSTIVDFSQADHGQVLRRGALSIEVLRRPCPTRGPGGGRDHVDAGDAAEDGPDESDVVEPDVVDAEVIEEPGADEGEESAADIRSQIENVDESAPGGRAGRAGRGRRARRG